MAQTILFVDDDPLMHRLFQHHLERAGYGMISATTCREALVTASTARPQLIVMDIMMPDMDGLSAIRELKRTEATKGIHVIVVTGSTTAHNAFRQEAEFAGAAAFLTKPLSPAQLLAEVRRLMPPESAPGQPGPVA